MAKYLFKNVFNLHFVKNFASPFVQISLHQLHIQKIENLDKLCRGLKIVYLQVRIKEEQCFRSVILIAFVILEVWKCEYYIFKGQRYHKDWESPPTEKPRVYQSCHERHRGEHFEINVEEKHRNSLHFGHNQTLLFSFSDCQLMIMIIFRFTTIRWWMVSQAVRVWRSSTSPSTLLARYMYILSLIHIWRCRRRG